MAHALLILLGLLCIPTLSISLRAARTNESVTEEEDKNDCLDAVPGDKCHDLVTYTLENGVKTHPDMFPSFSSSNSDAVNFRLIQEVLHSRSSNAGCGRPCWPDGAAAEAQEPPEAAASLVELAAQRWPRWPRSREAEAGEAVAVPPAETPASAAEEAKAAEAPAAAAGDEEFEREMADFAPQAAPSAAPAAAVGEMDFEKEMADFSQAKPETAPAEPAAEKAKPEAQVRATAAAADSAAAGPPPRSEAPAPPPPAAAAYQGLLDAEELPTGAVGGQAEAEGRPLDGRALAAAALAAEAAQAAAHGPEELPSGDVGDTSALERERLERAERRRLAKEIRERERLERERLLRAEVEEESREEERREDAAASRQASRQPWWKRLMRGSREAKKPKVTQSVPFGKAEPGGGWRHPKPDPGAAPSAEAAPPAAPQPQAAPAAPAPEARNSTAEGVAEQPAKQEASEECHDAAPGERCHELVQWSLDRATEQGADYNPEWFPTYDGSRSAEYNFKQIQEVLYYRGAAECRKPCGMPDEAAQPANLAHWPEPEPEDEEEDAEPMTMTTLEPLAAKSLPEMSPSDLLDYLNNQEELDKYAYYLTHTSRREKAAARGEPLAGPSAARGGAMPLAGRAPRAAAWRLLAARRGDPPPAGRGARARTCGGLAGGGASADGQAAAESLDWGRQRAELWAEKRRNREEKGYRGLAREERSDSLGERLLGEGPRRVLREIRQLGKERRWAEALLLLRAEADPAPALRTAAMNACAKALELEQARAVFDEMPEKTVAAYNVLVWMVGLRDPAGAERLVEEMPKQALRPDAGIFRSLIDTHGKAGDLKAAMRVFSQSRGDGIPPSTSTYQVLLSACTRAGDPDCAEELLADMRRAELQPDVGHWSSLVVSCSRGKDEARARAAFEGMRGAAVAPDAVAYTALISCFGGEGAFEKGQAAFAEMRSAAVSPDTFAYNALLDIAATEGDEERFEQVLSELDAAGLPRNRETQLRVTRLQKVVGARRRRRERAPDATPAAPLPPGWLDAVDPASGRRYYWRESDPRGTTTWERPTARAP